MKILNLIAMCLSAGIAKKKCLKGRAGIAKFWAADCEAVDDIIFDPVTCEATGIIMDVTYPSGPAIFYEFNFDKNTAFFNQAKARVGNGTSLNITQTISFEESIMTPELRKVLEQLNDCCCLIVIVKDNTGQYHLAGITYNAATGEWQSEDMITGEGSGNTGANPTADENKYVETLVAETGYYAPFWTGGEAGIPT